MIRIALYFLLISATLVACDKEQSVDFGDSKIEDVLPIRGDSWIRLLPELGYIGAIQVYNENLVIAYFDLVERQLILSGLWDGSELTPQISGRTGGTNFRGFKVTENQLYAVTESGIFGGTYRYHNRNDTAWIKLSSIGSPNDVLIYKDKLYMTSLGEPYIYVLENNKFIPIENQPNGRINSMVLYQGKLIVGGSFTKIGTMELSGIAQWDGTSWEGLGDHENTEIVGEVRALEVWNEKLVAGGVFKNAGQKVVNNIALWDGASWDDLDGGIEEERSSVNRIYVRGEELFIGGSFEDVGDVFSKNIIKYTDGSWQGLAKGVEGQVMDIAAYKGQLYVVSNNNSERNLFKLE